MDFGLDEPFLHGHELDLVLLDELEVHLLSGLRRGYSCIMMSKIYLAMMRMRFSMFSYSTLLSIRDYDTRLVIQ